MLSEIFFNKFRGLFEATHPTLFFTTDETMLQMTSHNKVIISTEVTHYFEEAENDLRHITGMCTTNIIGNSPPLFILLKGLKKLPAEFEILVATHQIIVASSPNG